MRKDEPCKPEICGLKYSLAYGLRSDSLFNINRFSFLRRYLNIHATIYPVVNDHLLAWIKGNHGWILGFLTPLSGHPFLETTIRKDLEMNNKEMKSIYTKVWVSKCTRFFHFLCLTYNFNWCLTIIWKLKKVHLYISTILFTCEDERS